VVLAKVTGTPYLAIALGKEFTKGVQGLAEELGVILL
jgi:hypothetical protein